MKYKEMIKQAINDFKNPKTLYKQIPNLLTLSRVLSPFIILPLALTGNLIPAIITSSLIATTDFFDGLIARKLNICTELGRQLDALSDKVFALSLTIPLLISNPIFLINVIFEGLIGGTNLLAKFKNKDPHTALIGKVKTFFLFGSIVMGYINLFNPINLGLFLGMICATCTIQGLTLATYINKNFIIDKKENKTNYNDLVTIENTQNYDNINEKNSIKEKTFNYENSNENSKENPKILILKK